MNMNLLLYLLVILVPFSQSFTVATIGNRPINLGMDTILIGIILMIYLFKSVFKRPRWVHNQAATLLLVWLGWNVFTIVISMLSLTLGQVIVSIVVLLRWGQYVPIFFLLASGRILTRSQCKKTIFILGVSGVLAAGLALYQVYSGLNTLYFKGAPSFTIPLFREANLAEQVGSSGFYEGSANYNVAGAYMLIALLMITPFILGAHQWFYRIGGIAIILLLIAGVVVTASRISMLAGVIGIGIGSYLYSKRLFCFTVILGVLGIVLAFFAFQETRIVVDLIETVTYLPQVIPMVLAGNYGSVEGGISLTVFGAAMRVVGAREALEIFLLNPVTGVGFFAYQYYTPLFTADNYYLQTLAETGLIGAGIMVLFFGSLIKSAGRATRRSLDSYAWKYRVGLLAMLVAMLVVNITGGIFYVQKVWGAFLIVCGVWYVIRTPRPLTPIRTQ